MKITKTCDSAVYVEIGKWTYYFDDSCEKPIAEKWLTSGEGDVVHDV